MNSHNESKKRKIENQVYASKPFVCPTITIEEWNDEEWNDESQTIVATALQERESMIFE